MTGPCGRKLNRKLLADTLGVSLPTVDAWRRKGCPFLVEGSKGIEWKFDSAAVIEWRIKEAVNKAVSVYVGGDGQVSHDEADRRRAVAQAIVAEVAADQTLQSVVHRHESEQDVAAFCGVLRAGLSNAISKIAARAASMTSAQEIQEFAIKEVNRTYADAQRELTGRWSSDETGIDDA